MVKGLNKFRINKDILLKETFWEGEKVVCLEKEKNSFLVCSCFVLCTFRMWK